MILTSHGNSPFRETSDLTMFDCVAHCPIGLEDVTAAELAGLGLEVVSAKPNEGRVEWRGTLADVAAANLVSRTAERVTLALDRFRAMHFPELRRKAAQIEWERWIGPDDRVALRVTSKRSKLYHERAIAERIAGAISDRLGREVGVASGDALDDPDAGVQLVLVRVFKDEATLRLDTSGPRLHRRGYRQATAKAPLRETLAAALLAASGWRPGNALVDPFCGSGTIPIEAASWAAGIAPGTARTFRFEHWPQRVERPELESPGEPPSAPIIGSDRDAGAIEASRSNRERAGVDVDFVQRSVSEVEAPADASTGWIVTNPPYALRTDAGGDVRDLYGAFGQVLRERFAGWNCTMLCADDAFAQATAVDWDAGPLVSNGGVRVRVLHRVL